MIYNADSIPAIRAMLDKSVDLVIGDPPYGMNYLSNHYKNGNPFSAIANDDHYPADIIPELKRVARKAVFMFCRWDNLTEVEKPNSFIVWIKNNWSAGDLNHQFGRQWEGVLFYALEQHKFSHRPPDVFDCRRVPSGELQHPTQKPVSLIRWLIENNSDPGDIILDPFMGSGTTGVACVETDRNFIGYEIEQRYFGIAQARIGGANRRLF